MFRVHHLNPPPPFKSVILLINNRKQYLHNDSHFSSLIHTDKLEKKSFHFIEPLDQIFLHPKKSQFRSYIYENICNDKNVISKLEKQPSSPKN